MTPESIEEHLFPRGVDHMRILICLCVGACDHTHYMTRPDTQTVLCHKYSFSTEESTEKLTCSFENI